MSLPTPNPAGPSMRCRESLFPGDKVRPHPAYGACYCELGSPGLVPFGGLKVGGESSWLRNLGRNGDCVCEGRTGAWSARKPRHHTIVTSDFLYGLAEDRLSVRPSVPIGTSSSLSHTLLLVLSQRLSSCSILCCGASSAPGPA
jgi:hypothetical protein